LKKTATIQHPLPHSKITPVANAPFDCCPFGVRQCFALPLLFLFVFGCFFAFTPEKKQKQNTRNKSGRAKHCRTPQQKQKISDSCLT
jgi:hypothetical protein